ncbi:protein sidekick-1-like isoform X3 [Apostichopus japonicus]|uniref:protein sidekick-1-like isoform X3 n=1 Tax=Stichopus japonicus TaxID=307972 RepID=UPI003AB865E3
MENFIKLKCEGCQAQYTERSIRLMRTLNVSARNILSPFRNSSPLWALVFLLCVMQSFAVAPPFITQHPEGDITLENNVEVLRCSAIGDAPLLYRWWKDDVPVMDSYISSSNYRLAAINRNDAGMYRCLVNNPVGTIISKVANIQVAYMGEFPTSGSSLSQMAGNAVIISCPAIESYPPPVISWTKGEDTILPSGRTIVTLDGRLVLMDLTASDAGRYVCHAENTESAYQVESAPISLLVTSPSAEDATSTEDTTPLTIMVPPKDVVVYEGASLAEMECIVNGRPFSDLAITWRRNGEDYSSGGSELFKLQIRSPSMADQGIYVCEASLPNGAVVTASANLTYFTMPAFTISPDLTTVSPVGSTIVIPCQATGNPQPSLVWYQNAVDVVSLNNPRYQILSTGSLQIRDLEKPDGAMYQCRIHNEVGEDIKDTLLEVKEIAPEFTSYPNDTLILAGESTLLECQASGAPVPTIQWYKDGSLVASEDSTQNARYVFESGNLRIQNALTTDSGQFMCEAVNTKGAINITAVLNVYERTYISQRPANTEQILAQTTLLECEVHHDNRIAPSIVWLHDGLEVDVTDSRISLKTTGSLEITTVRQSDAGNYECRVTSLAGNDHAVALLSIIQLPFAPVSLQASISPSDSRTITLTWVAPFDGNTPLLRYIIDQKEDLSSYREIESTVDPSVTSFDVVGKPARSYQYRIRAENKVGTGVNSQPSKAVSLPQEPPDDPAQRVVASASSTTSIIVEWQEPSEDSWNGPLLGYIVRHRLEGYQNNEWAVENITNVRQTSFTVTGLMIWERYEIQVAAYNAAGVGTFSDSVREQTHEGVPSDPPKNVVIQAVNSTSIMFAWAPPDAWSINGINQGYKLHAQEVDREGPPLEIIVPPTPGVTRFMEHMVGLKKYTEYITSVLCYTNPGDGPPSTLVTVRTEEDIPGPVKNLRVSNVQAMSLTLEWDPPMEANGILTDYWVHYVEVNKSANLVEEELKPEQTHLHITQLKAETTYSFSVWAETSKGPGEIQTTIISSGTPPVLPEAPTSLVISDIRSRSVNLRFTPGHDGHASISRWTVEAMVGLNSTWRTVFTTSAPDASAFEMTGLIPYTAYTFRLIATNVAGDSPPSENSNSIQTSPDVPGIAPREVNVRAYSESSLRIRWVPLVQFNWNGEAIGYRITWSKAGATSANPISRDINDPYSSQYIITGLEEYTGYQVTIRAVNALGGGPSSAVKTEWTHETVPSAGPEDLGASAVDHMSVDVVWGEIPAQERNGIIVGYKVRYQETDRVSEPKEEDISNNATREFTITGLKGYTSYSILVVGKTRIGDGTPSETITIRTSQSEPGPPMSLHFPTASEASVRLVWTAPDEPNGVIDNYRISYRLSGDSQIINTHEGSNLHYVANGLEGNKMYTFTVTAHNGEGWGAPASANVITSNQRAKPDPPSIVNVNHVQSRQADLSWTPGSYNDAPLRSYRIRVRIHRGSWMDHATTIPPDAISYTVMGLKPDTSYEFKIQASNDVGSSSFSDPSAPVATLEDAPEGSPTIVEVRPYTTTAVNVTWQAPPADTFNGALLGYQIIFRKLPDGSEVKRLIEDPHAVHKSLENLLIFQDYEITVAAYNKIGTGPLSRPWTVFVGEAVPSAAPTSVRVNANSPNSLTVSWSPPPVDTLSGGLQGYKVIYWEVDMKRDADTQTRTYGSTSTLVTLDGLQCATTYGLVVKGFNAAGEGPASDVHMSTTDEDIPGEVEFLSFTQIRMTSLMVTWGEPPKSCGNITYYKLSYQSLQTINGEKSLILNEIPASKTTYNVAELEPNVPYLFSISARTASKPQYGPIVAKNITTGPQLGAPGSPRNVRLEVDEGTLTLLWEEPENFGFSRILGYIIEYKEQNQNDWIMLTDEIPPSEESYQFSYQELNSATVYSFRVLAENAQSISEPAVLPEPFDTSAVSFAGGAQANFYEEWWFLVIVALIGIIIIILVGASLCMLGRSKLYKEKKKKRINHVHQPSQEDDNDFAPIEMNTGGRRGPRNGNYTSTNSYRRMKLTRPPPKPSPGSVQYSEEEESKHYEPVTKRDTAETTSLTERYAESVGSESEAEMKEEAMDTFVNHYASLPSNQNWRQQRAAPQAYSYTDSEPDHNSVTMYNNGVAQLEAGSRTPIHGFSSFV